MTSTTIVIGILFILVIGLLLNKSTIIKKDDMNTKPDSSQVLHNGVPLDTVIDGLGASPTPTASSVTNVPAGNIAATNVQAALNELDIEKQATLVSGTNIKTINSQSILGSGNLVVAGGGSSGPFINVADYGVTGNGVADDAPAFSAAYAAAPAGATIFVPAPAVSYVLTTTAYGSKTVHWLCDFDITTMPLIFNLPGYQTATLSNTYIVNRKGTVADSPTQRIRRETNYTGGANGYVNAALRTDTVVGAGAKNYEWTLLSVLDNSSTTADGSENVAIYGQSIKRSTGTTWAGCFEIRDEHTAGNSVGASLGVEISAVTTTPSTDTGYLRNGVNVAGIATGGVSDWGRGFWTSSNGNMRFREAFSNTAPYTKAVFFNSGAGQTAAGETPALIRDTGSAMYGVDLSGAAYSTGVAIRLGDGQKIEFTPAYGGAYMNFSSGMFHVVGAGMYVDGVLGFSSSLVSGSATAGAASLPAAPVTFLKVLIDGAEYKIPLYG